MKKLSFIFLFLISVVAQAQLSKVVPKKPNPFRLVNDYTTTLTPVQVQALEQKLNEYDKSTSTQIAIVIVNSLEGYDVAEYGLYLGREWGVGGKNFSNGVVILVAIKDKKIRIEVGYGLEGAIPDVTAKSINDNDITPAFRQENYYRGLDKAVDDIIKAAAGEYKAPAGYRSKKKGIGFGSIFILLFILLIIFSGGGRGGGMVSRRGFGGFGTGWLLGSLMGGSGSGGGGWSGGGGGGGSFGGGSFGGGGASGSW